eukprot:TRINITY_DN15396_c0_g3_i1.p1 TRINITY_DN15396_c0_g3~~TRINITY_DN15396_c0_g3_i1.p1  ORF type:complete len:113 (-),score=11.40 TRINITY_DN15396_c0_g3_i1:152-490(-)
MTFWRSPLREQQLVSLSLFSSPVLKTLAFLLACDPTLLSALVILTDYDLFLCQPSSHLLPRQPLETHHPFCITDEASQRICSWVELSIRQKRSERKFLVPLSFSSLCRSPAR